MEFDLTSLLEPVLLALATALAGVITAWGVQQVRKLGLQVSAEQQAQVEKFIADKILEIAERSAAAQKVNAHVQSGAQKLQEVVTATLTKFPRITAEEAQSITTAMLPKLGEGALAGAIGVGKALGTRP